MFQATDVLNPEFIQQPPRTLWQHISPLYSIDESTWLEQLIPLAKASEQELVDSTQRATELVTQVRADNNAIQMVDSLLAEYSLDTQEGIQLMCLAEALMRIPDSETADALIRDKLSIADWESHLSNSDSLFVNASTWGLMLTGKVVSFDQNQEGQSSNILKRLVNKFSEPVIRQVMHQAMKVMGHQFVLGRTITEALKRGNDYRNKGYSYSFDMLGEAALTTADAEKYLASYARAIDSLGQDNYQYQGERGGRPTISIKLSALHPRYEAGQKQRVMTELFERVLGLIEQARALDVGITIDAEEADRLELSLELFEKLYRDPKTQGWGNFGLVVQAYSKRALPVLAWLASLAQEQGDLIPVRLVKGAYWDSEIKLCQQRGLSGYPVYTRKEGTDTSYLACARFLLSEHIRGKLYPQFASHNAHTVATIHSLATHQDFEFQRLHGMGDALYNNVLENYDVDVRIYAPVGNHKDLLPYLVRRLLENGANSSFVHRLVDAETPIAELIQHPVSTLLSRETLHNAHIPLPEGIFSNRKNSFSPNIEIEQEWQDYSHAVQAFMNNTWTATSIINGEDQHTTTQHPVKAPYDHMQVVGHVDWADQSCVEQALEAASAFFPTWRDTPVTKRAQTLEKLADLLEENLAELSAICHREAGKTIQDAIDEVREAVDFCRYYAQQAKQNFASPKPIMHLGNTAKVTKFQGRGIFVCISPWNFPLAIFLGQISAALAAGNCVIAKPAEQTSLIAHYAIRLMLKAGIPADAIQLLPGDGASVGAPLLADTRIAGVAFTGSTETAQIINRSLAARDCMPVPFIAETGGQNAMLVDSSALPEQVVRDVLRSAFASAGQRCSALRVLYIQSDIADRVIEMLHGAMQEQVVGLPYLHETDVGPVIDAEAQVGLLSHIAEMRQQASLIGETPLPNDLAGTFVAPIAFEIESINQLKKEQFGPILHIIRYPANKLDQVIDEINATGFGLTLGVHSRNESTCQHIVKRVRAGNAYINRDQVGAVVGVQPFGGQGLSGTGPKAGGPHYLYRFTQEVVL